MQPMQRPSDPYEAKCAGVISIVGRVIENLLAGKCAARRLAKSDH